MSARRPGIVLLRALISLALIALILVKVGPDRILRAAKGAEPWPLVLALALGLPRLLVKIARWKILAGRAVGTGWRLAARSLLVGTAGAVVTPGRFGQAGSALLFPPGNRLVLSGLALTDPLADLLIALVLVAFQAGGAGPGVAAVVACCAAAYAAPRTGGALATRGGKIRAVGTALSVLNTSTIAGVAALSVLIYAFNLVQFHLLLNAHESVPFAASAASLPLIFLAVACPITIAGFGLREVASALTLARWGVEPGVAVRASFELFVINLLLPGLVGAVLAGRMGISPRSRATASEEQVKAPGEDAERELR